MAVEERDQIIAKMQALLSSFEANRLKYAIKNGSGARYSRGKELAWARAAHELKALLEEIDPDSLIPVEQPLIWHSDYNEFAEACGDSLSRGMLRKCLQCSKCKAGMEVEVVKGEPVTKKRIQCSCGHVQLVSFFQNGQ